ncbi:hypothetical protein SAMN05428964_105339 [Thalassospira xiamenensis]|uniref:Uncharacterized protein n=1 Tax=Thalassospira xiamenensis TaxID=220697 RepID=A0A285TT78_9PROT|nr:hypothetical protein SAMN05428964_105339 [Thalassospira xiamenensis]
MFARRKHAQQEVRLEPVLSLEGLYKGLSACRPVDGATTFLLSCLIYRHSNECFPQEASKPAAFIELSSAHRSLASYLAETSNVPVRGFVVCNKIAFAVVAETIATEWRFPGRRRDECLKVWRLLHSFRGELRKSIQWLRYFEQVTGTEAVPRRNGDPLSDVDILKAGSRVPDFLKAPRL